jgi:hypothetical protein
VRFVLAGHVREIAEPIVEGLAHAGLRLEPER